MRPVPYCLPEITEMIFAAARMVSEDVFIHKRVIATALGAALANDDEDSPQELALTALRAAYKALGVTDPYENEKARRNRAMLGLENFINDYLTTAESAFAASVRLSLAANGEKIKRLGREELEKELSARLMIKPAIDKITTLAVQVAKSPSVMFIADCAGEIVADKFLITELRHHAKVEVVVAAKPIMGRATLADAEMAGLTEIATVTDPGADMLGLSLGRAAAEFRRRFAAADLVIAKGAFNWQTLKDCNREVFCLVQAEGASIAKELNVAVGDGVITVLNDK
ncbi:MAG: ARMT1-like domain-containing protein [Planctomycetota bacterium]|nr:ARMT1-like domain-containing protein [Planctomycetota bacterium]